MSLQKFAEIVKINETVKNNKIVKFNKKKLRNCQPMTSQKIVKVAET